MGKSQNRSMRNRRKHGNMTLQKVNNHTKVDSEGDETSLSEFKIMMKNV
jgi:hypothetical protein